MAIIPIYAQVRSIVLMTMCLGVNTLSWCGNGKYHPYPESHPLASRCENCPSGKVSVTTQIAFRTKKNTCELCPINTYPNQAPAAYACTNCPANSFTNSGGKRSKMDCVCKVGYRFRNGYGSACDMCIDGFYNPSKVGAIKCDTCEAGYESAEEGTSCKPCPTGRTNEGDGGACGCPRHQELSENRDCIKVMCFPGQYVLKEGYFIQPEDSSLPRIEFGVTCSSCPEGSFTLFPNILPHCHPCLMGTYTATTGTQECTSCGVGEYQDEVGQTSCNKCVEGTYKPLAGPGDCTVCPTGMTSASGSDALTDCVCLPAHTETSDGTRCISCDVGTYMDVTGSVDCLACPVGTSSTKGSTEVTDCTCLPGYTAASDGVACTACDAGTFKDVKGSTACETCRVNSESLSGSVLCLCSAGFTDADNEWCASCDAGTFKSVVGSAVCTSCPSHTSGVSKSIELTNCKCVAGYTASSDGVACTACEAGTYKVGTGVGECSTCPTGTDSAMGSDKLTDCTCLSEYSGVWNGRPCTPCEDGTWKAATGVGMCSNCPEGMGARPGSSSIQDCFVKDACSAGWYDPFYLGCRQCPEGTISGNDNVVIACEPCPINTYAEKRYAATSCTACPAGMFTLDTGNFNRMHCECGLGYHWTDNSRSSCDMCTGGFYNADTYNTDECSLCPEGYGSVDEGTTCKQCTVDKTNKGDGRPCECKSPKVPNAAGDCIMRSCYPGQYMFAPGYIIEPSNAWTPPIEIGPHCISCPAGSFQSAVNMNEVCIPCFEGSYTATVGKSECTLCGMGRYQEERGQKSCTDCDAGKFKPMIGEGVCSMCPVGKSSAIEGTHECTPCGVGKYQDEVGQTSCKDCDAGMFKPTTGAGVCSVCPKGTSSPSASDELMDCTCLAGYSGTLDGRACNVCPEGKYKVGTGIGQCLDCPAFTSSLSASDELVDCKCLAGYSAELDGQACSVCPKGKYKTVTGAFACSVCQGGTSNDDIGSTSAGACVQCDGGTWSGDGDATCTTCPSQTSSAAGSNKKTDCKCLAGYGAKSEGQVCSICLEGEYKAVGVGMCSMCPGGTSNNNRGSTSADACGRCIGGTWSGDGAATCTTCPSHTTSDDDSDELIDCKCLAGYTAASDGQECSTCRKGEYKTETGAFACSRCQGGTSNDDTGSTSVDACVECGANAWSGDGAATCTTCPSQTSSVSGSNEKTDCKCLAGYTAQSDGVACIACEAGSYKLETGTAGCTTCPSGSESTSGSDEQCHCGFGYHWNGGYGNNCDMCIGGTYNPNKWDTTLCELCPAGKESAEEGTTCKDCPLGKDNNGDGSGCECIYPTEPRTNSDDCMFNDCAAGYYVSQVGVHGVTPPVCTPCPIGSFRNSRNTDRQCESCPEGSTTYDMGGVSVLDCYCAAGYTHLTDVVCEQCAVGTYKPTTTNDDCKVCPANTISVEGSVHVSQCVCVGGYSNLQDGVPCIQCEEGTYKDQRGNVECTMCPGHKSSPVGSVLESDCVCIAGYYEDGVTCKSCPVGTTSLFGSTSILQCMCMPGWTFNGERCTPCPPGSHKLMIGNEVPCTAC